MNLPCTACHTYVLNIVILRVRAKAELVYQLTSAPGLLDDLVLGPDHLLTLLSGREDPATDRSGGLSGRERSLRDGSIKIRIPWRKSSSLKERPIKMTMKTIG